jgi:hypothetical protein
MIWKKPFSVSNKASDVSKGASGKAPFDNEYKFFGPLLEIKRVFFGFRQYFLIAI